MSKSVPSRRFARAPFGSTVQLWSNRAAKRIKASDISGGGLFLQTDSALPSGSYLTVRIQLPGESGFSALCRVAREDPGRTLIGRRGVALEFIDIGPSNRARILGYVDRARSRLSFAVA